MNVPPWANSFSRSVEADSRRLIESGLWPVTAPNLNGWLGQFCGDVEKFFASMLLNQLTLRTHRQFESGLKCLFRGNVSRVLFPDSHDIELVQRLRDRKEPGIRLVPVICDDDPPIKSGPLVLRRLQRLLRLHTEWMVWPWQAAELAKEGKLHTVIFVDDFLGGGTQFGKFFRKWQFDVNQSCRFVYAPVAAHSYGREHIAEKYPSIEVLAAEELNAASSMFSEEVWALKGQQSVSPSEAQNWYEEFAKDKGLVGGKVGALGFGGQALTFGFAHSTPNNTLPILWKSTEKWRPLLER